MADPTPSAPPSPPPLPPPEDGISVEGSGEHWHAAARLRWWKAVIVLLVLLMLALATRSKKVMAYVCGTTSDIMRGPVERQMRPPCPNDSVQMVGGCWVAAIHEGAQRRGCAEDWGVYQDPTGLCWFPILGQQQPGRALDEPTQGDWPAPANTHQTARWSGPP